MDVVTFRLVEDIEFRLGREIFGRAWANLDGSALAVEQAGLELTVVGEACPQQPNSLGNNRASVYA